MFAECALFGQFFSFVKAVDPIVFTSVFLSKEDVKTLEDRARTVARRFGISADKWLEWRKGFGAARDLLMIADPEGESARIKRRRVRPPRAAKEINPKNEVASEHD